MASFGGFCFAAAVVALLVTETVEAKQTVPQILVKNGLPRGLLPATVRSYTLAANGKFQVNLRSTCTTKLAGQEVYYKKTITGVLSYRKISNLAGIQVHESFIWISVSGIEVDKILPKTIWFKLGYFSEALSTDFFQVAPLCNFFSEEEAEEHKDAVTFSQWLSKALNGILEVNAPHILGTGAARKLSQ